MSVKSSGYCGSLIKSSAHDNWELDRCGRHYPSVLAVLYVNYLNRRQSRQIELHRTDPSVPLKPPPHTFWVWCRNHSPLLGGIPGALALTRNLRANGPVTRGFVVSIALDISAIILAVALDFAATVYRQFVESETLITRLLGKMSDGLAVLSEMHKGAGPDHGK